jgi:cobalt/nickel transport system permease protein
MHIPDGYLGLSTWLAFYVIMIPVWFYASYRLKRDLRSREVPLLALAAAFSFVIMMFNIPVFGGSTGHAVGGAIIGIILGPWAALVSISVALVIQAFVFGDGGITTLAVNCFNMAFVLPMSAWIVYRLISGRSEISSKRRLVASAIAGYVSLSLAAACAAFVFGMQPILYHTASGQPLYMPWGLNVTLPIFLGEHLLILSFIEALVTVLIFSYVQKNEPSLLEERKPRKKKQPPVVV